MESATLLVVDDEPTNLAAMRTILEPYYRLIFARSGTQALAAARKIQPSLILLDIRMEDMDGYQVCQELKADSTTECIPIIFVTGLNDVGNESQAFSAGAVDYIVKPVSAEVVLARVRTHLSLVDAKILHRSYREAIAMLGSAGEFRDTDTGLHIWRMAAYAKELARSSGWSSEQADILGIAAPMHDTGKIGIPDNILQKRGKLTVDEWAIMKTHCRIGSNILSQSDAPIFKLAASVALHHHEKWDGNGYPDQLSGEDIPEAARIVAIADVFDALSMNRPYKEAWSLDKVTSTIIDGSGNHFDPRLIEVFSDRMARLVEIREEWQELEHSSASLSDVISYQ